MAVDSHEDNSLDTRIGSVARTSFVVHFPQGFLEAKREGYEGVTAQKSDQVSTYLYKYVPVAIRTASRSGGEIN